MRRDHAAWRALLTWEEQRQVVLDLVADRVHGVAFSLVDPQLQAVVRHQVGVIRAQLCQLGRHIAECGIE